MTVEQLESHLRDRAAAEEREVESVVRQYVEHDAWQATEKAARRSLGAAERRPVRIRCQRLATRD